jgi:hypothetical protein
MVDNFCLAKTYPLILSFPLSSTVGGGSGTVGQRQSWKWRENKKEELHTRDQFCQLGSFGLIACESASH